VVGKEVIVFLPIESGVELVQQVQQKSHVRILPSARSFNRLLDVSCGT
jgi:hypothetical protein